MVRKQTIIMAAVFILIAFIIYSRAITGEFVFDDYEYIVDNPLIHDFSHLSMSDPRQVGYLSFAVNYAIGGENPLGYHLVNVANHAVNAILVFVLVGSFLSVAARTVHLGRKHLTIALLSAALFLVHPVQTQAVSYITQRFTSLTTLFYLLAVLLYLKSRLILERDQHQSRGYGIYVLALLSTILAMRTKEIAFTIPFAVSLIELTILQGSVFGKRRFIFLVPFAAALLIIPLSIFGPELGILGPGEGIVETTRGDKVFDFRHRSTYEYLLTQLRVQAIYLRLLILPVGQSVVYDLTASRTFLDVKVLLSLLLLLAVAAAGWFSWRRAAGKNDADAAEYKLVTAGIAWFFLTISIESSIIPIKDLIFEHRIYLPSVGFFAVTAVALRNAVDRSCRSWSEHRKTVVLFLVCVPLAIVTFVRNDVWSSELKLWDDVVLKVPGKPIGYNNRGTAYAKARQYGLALSDLDRTIGFFPKSFSEMPSWENADLIPSNMSKTFVTRGQIQLALGNTAAANEDFERAKNLVAPPSDITQNLMLGDLYYERRAYRHAIEEYNKILQWAPDNADALNNRGNSYSQIGKYDAAVRDFDQLIGLEPGHALAYHNRGIAFAWMNQKDKAIADFTTACSMGFVPACDSIEIARKGGK